MNASPAPTVRYHALDIWRGIVCLVVVLEHVGVIFWFDGVARAAETSGWIYSVITRCLDLNLGAPLFFVISGYCILASLDSTRRKGIAPIRFMARRLWRIFPPYWASMAIIGGLVLLLDWAGLQWLHQTDRGLEVFDPRQFAWDQWFGNITLTETYRQDFVAGNDIHLLNRVAWALCYQEQFYIVCFLILVFAARNLYRALGIATLAIVFCRVEAWDLGATKWIQGLFPDLWHEFAVGLLLYWRINVARSTAERRGAEVLMVGLAAVGLTQGLVTTAAAAFFGLILLIAHRWDEAIARIRRPSSAASLPAVVPVPPSSPVTAGQSARRLSFLAPAVVLDFLRACGRRSYSIYLIHLPVTTVGNTLLYEWGCRSMACRAFIILPVVTAASVVAGWVFYACVDSHFTNLPLVGRWGRWVKPRQPGMVLPQAQV